MDLDDSYSLYRRKKRPYTSLIDSLNGDDNNNDNDLIKRYAGNPSPYIYSINNTGSQKLNPKPTDVDSIIKAYTNNYVPPSYTVRSPFANQSQFIGPIAFIQPATLEIARIIKATHMAENLPQSTRNQFERAVKEVRLYVDGKVRAHYGILAHHNAIRALNNPQTTALPPRLRRVQLAGEEFFGLNRFMDNFPDVADIQWWSLYKEGSWTLHTINNQG